MTDDALQRDTFATAVRALERADQAHARIDRQAEWMRAVDERLIDFSKTLSRVSNDVVSLKVKVALGAAIGSMLGGLAVGIVLKLIG